MKKTLLLLAAATVGYAAWAQDSYEAAEFAGSDLNGTARYVGMGGALSALGGDISTMGTNPAGTAMFRKSEVAISLSGLFTNEKGQLGHDASRASLDQAGVVFSLNQDNPRSRGLQYINFGINYVKRRNHFSNQNTTVENLMRGDFSQTYQVGDMANASTSLPANEPWPVLADIFAPTFKDGVCQHDGVLGYDEATGAYLGMAADQAFYQRATYGSTTQADFNLSFNVSDRFFWGFSLGVYDMNFKRESLYGEVGMDKNYYDILNWYDSSAEGFDVKLGFICRPIENSPFRCGVSIHTPIWYHMDDVNGWSLVYNEGKTVTTTHPDGSKTELFGYTQESQTEPFRYNYRTPWTFAFSLGHTVGNYLAFGAEYEFSDASSAKYTSEDWDETEYFRYVNNKISNSLRTQHTLRLGMEYKPVSEFAFRLGYNYVSSPIKDTAYRALDYYYDMYPTETAYTNWKGINRITFGVGYRFKGGYFDIAYQYQAQKGDFYAFDGDYEDTDGYHAFLPTSVNNDRSQVMATLGFRF